MLEDGCSIAREVLVEGKEIGELIPPPPPSAFIELGPAIPSFYPLGPNFELLGAPDPQPPGFLACSPENATSVDLPGSAERQGRSAH